MICVKLLENEVDVIRAVVLWSCRLILGREICKEVPSHDRRFVPSAETVQHVPEGNTLGLISGVEPSNAMV